MSFKDVAVFIIAAVALLSLGDMLGSAYTGAAVQTMACDASGCKELCNRDLDCSYQEVCCDAGLYGYCAAKCDKSRTLEIRAVGAAPTVEQPLRVPGVEIVVYRVLMVFVIVIAAAYFLHRSRHKHRRR